MRKRQFLGSLLSAAGVLLVDGRRREAFAAPQVSRLKITRIRLYEAPQPRPSFNQSNAIVTVETDQGLTGIGEGGARDTLEQLAGLLIGEDASRIEHLWQLMYRGYFYPPGREKLHAQGALDLALWDIRGKALGVPVHQLLGGITREHVPCYATAFPDRGSPRESARACIEAGFKAYRTHGADPGGDSFDSRAMVRRTHELCRELQEGVSPDGDWAIDFHTRFDLPDAIRLSHLIEDLEPFFVEDLVRSEEPAVYRTLRPQVRVPIAVGEHFGDRWDMNELVEEHLIDYSRVTLPNAGGITELRKQAALCETHYVGLVPHFTGPVATAALVHVLASFPGPVCMEVLGEAPGPEPHLPQHCDFRNGKLWPNERPGLGVEFDPRRAKLVAEVTEHRQPIRLFRRPDGSITNW
jgi:L-alanine-DL-glutamate epimerase-like enolase superfamily enzyme